MPKHKLRIQHSACYPCRIRLGGVHQTCERCGRQMEITSSPAKRRDVVGVTFRGKV